MTRLPDFGNGPTLGTLHAYAQAVVALPRALGGGRPKWWHGSFTMQPNGFVTHPIPLPGAGVVQLRMDPAKGVVVLETTLGEIRSFPMSEGWTATEMGEGIFAAVKELSDVGEVERSRYENDDERRYDPQHAVRLHRALSDIEWVLYDHRASVDPTGPTQVWAHGFDVAFEWFGSKKAPFEKDGKTTEISAQIATGFYPHDRPYFYSNPWPFDASFTEVELPGAAAWRTEDWTGSILYLDDIKGDDGAEQVLRYLAAVHGAAAASLK